MAYDGRILALARDDVAERRRRNDAEHQRRRAEVYEKLPALRAVDGAFLLGDDLPVSAPTTPTGPPPALPSGGWRPCDFGLGDAGRSAEGDLYEDAGEWFVHRQGHCRLVRFVAATRDGRLTESATMVDGRWTLRAAPVLTLPR